MFVAIIWRFPSRHMFVNIQYGIVRRSCSRQDNYGTSAKQPFESCGALRNPPGRLTHLGRGAGSALRLHERLFETPILGVRHASEFLGIGFAAANRLVDRMVERGVLVEVTGHARNRRFAYQRYIALFDD